MYVITPEVINHFNLYYLADPKTMRRGQQLYNEGRAVISQYWGDSLECMVNAREAMYRVEMRMVRKNELKCECTCATSTQGKYYCEHMIAAYLAASRYIYSEAPKKWQYRLGLALETAPRKAASRSTYAVILGLQRMHYYESSRFALQIYTLRSSQLPALKEMGDQVDAAALNEWLEKNMSWRHYATTPYQALQSTGCINLPPDGVATVNLMLQSRRFYEDIFAFAQYLPLLAKLDAPLFSIHEGKFKDRIQIVEEPVEVAAALVRSKEGLTLQADLTFQGQVYSSIKDTMHVVSLDPPWVLAGKYLLPVKNPQTLPILSTLPLNIPADQQEEFRERYLAEIANRMPIQGDVVAWEEVRGEPVPRLYLRDEGGKLLAGLLICRRSPAMATRK